MPKATLSRQLETVVHPLTGAPADYEPLLALIGNAPFVLLGEASHGTHEFYRERAQITKRLIQEQGFTTVAVEADWPDAVLIGFSTYSGTVTAATEWGGPAERKRVRPALPDSYEALFHELDLGRFLVALRDGGAAIASLCQPRLERAIGVIYRPETERLSHYFSARLPEQFDAVLHFDETRAVEPLERTTTWDKGEAPETFPSGL